MNIYSNNQKEGLKENHITKEQIIHIFGISGQKLIPHLIFPGVSQMSVYNGKDALPSSVTK